MYDNRLHQKSGRLPTDAAGETMLQIQESNFTKVTKMQKEEIDHGKSFIKQSSNA